METLKRTEIGYENDRVELMRMNSGRYYICNGCEPLGFADRYDDAYFLYQKKVTAFKAKRTRELNKTCDFLRKNKDSIDIDLVLEVFKNKFHTDENKTRWILETRGIIGA